jgi:chromosome segregation ATPase
MKDEREEKNILQERLEDLEKKYTELEDDRKNSLLRAESEINEIKREYCVCREEKLLINKKFMDTKDQISGLKKALESKYEEYDQLEREYKSTQEAHRKMLDQHQRNSHERDEYLKALKDIQSQYGILFDCQKQWEKERVELHGAISDLTQRLEKATTMQQDEIKASKEKLHEYKTKLRLANSKLKSYAEKISELDQAEEAF